VPHAADQFENAAALAAAGVARVVMPDELSETSIREAARALLEDDAFRDAARAVAAEIAAMPDATQVAQQIEEHCLSVA
jgi:UDP:flavonoid glycosyltransferase YjiC (YdhE family)